MLFTLGFFVVIFRCASVQLRVFFSFSHSFFASLFLLNRFVLLRFSFSRCASIFLPLIFGVAFRMWANESAMPFLFITVVGVILLNVLCVVIWHATNINSSTRVRTSFSFSRVKCQESEIAKIKTHSRPPVSPCTHKYTPCSSIEKLSRKTLHEIETKHKRSRVHCQNWILKRLTSLIRLQLLQLKQGVFFIVSATIAVIVFVVSFLFHNCFSLFLDFFSHSPHVTTKYQRSHFFPRILSTFRPMG